MKKLSIVWFRRNMRTEDNRVMGEATRNSDSILPIFIFDTTVLSRFKNKFDRRLSFIANILFDMNAEFQKFNGELTVLYGNPVAIVPKLAKFVGANSVFADEDFEPENIVRDEKIRNALSKQDQEYELHIDHVLTRPGVIVKSDETPFKKFTPYMRVYKDYLDDNAEDVMAKYTYKLRDKVSDVDLSKCGLKLINVDVSPKDILDQIGYEWVEDDRWHPSKAKRLLHNFIQTKIKDYKDGRNYMAMEGTSTLSPYIRFGVISVRECLHQAWPHRKGAGGDQWIMELMWREFYISIMYHFPEAVVDEFQEKYRNTLPWKVNKAHFKKFCEGKTGFPIVDASIMQLLEEGWMHNRCRMIVSMFLTKNLFIDWREGEEFFAQNLMDYDLSSNVGGWQWSGSVGVDAQPYFRMFNPDLQQKKYDADCLYIKKYLPELAKVPAKTIHSPDLHLAVPSYPKRMVDYEATRQIALEYFRKIDRDRK